MDRIDFTWPEAITLKENLPPADEWIDSITVIKRDSNRIILKPAALKAIDSEHLIAVLDENASDLHTGFLEVYIRLTDVPVTADTLPTLIDTILDRAGPVIGLAYVDKGGITTQNSFDTLTVLFSEPIKWTEDSFSPDQLFNFFGGSSSNGEYPFNDLTESSILSFDSMQIRIIMDNGYSFTCETDSINIKVDKKNGFDIFSDFHKNQPSYNNRKEKLTGNYTPEISICPNPFTPGMSTDPTSGKKGTLLIVQCERSASQFEGTVSIFNVPGNVVLYKKSMSVNQVNSRWLTYLWNGKDKFGMKVKSGVYVALITIKDKQSGNIVATYRKKVGVKGDI
jgi:hypothetical protein